MCVGIPMRVVAIDGIRARCDSDDRSEIVDLSLVPQVRVGDEVLVFLGLARQVLSAQEAAQIRAALGSLAAIAAGTASPDAIARGFADLIDRAPQLPPHLEAARAAGNEVG